MAQPGTTASHPNIHELVTALRLDEAAYRRAVELAQRSPSGTDWKLRYINCPAGLYETTDPY